MNNKYGHNPEQRRKRRLQRIKQGWCPVHAKEVVVEGRTKCAKCLVTTRLSSLRKKGLPSEEIEKARLAIDAFDGNCQCCGSDKSGCKMRGFHLDHDDALKIFRGIICANCNLVIGHAKETIWRLEAAIKYLERVK